MTSASGLPLRTCSSRASAEIAGVMHGVVKALATICGMWFKSDSSPGKQRVIEKEKEKENGKLGTKHAGV